MVNVQLKVAEVSPSIQEKNYKLHILLYKKLHTGHKILHSQMFLFHLNNKESFII